MPTVWEIIRRRWPEVMLITVLCTGFFAVTDQLGAFIDTDSAKPQISISQGKAFLLGAGYMIFAIVLQMLSLGFLASSVDREVCPQEPARLAIMGRFFFWRFFRFQLFLAFVILFILSPMVLIILSKLFLGGQVEFKDMPNWLFGVSDLVIFLLLFKPIVIVPAIMIGMNKMVTESLWVVRRYRLGEFKGLFGVCAGLIAGAGGISLCTELFERGTVKFYIALVASSLLSSIVFFVISLRAVRYVVVREGVLQPASVDEDNSGDYYDG